VLPPNSLNRTRLIPEGLKAMFYQIFGCSEIEPRIELVDDTFESNY